MLTKEVMIVCSHLNSVEVYNPKTDIWSVLPSNLNIGRSYTGVCVIDKPWTDLSSVSCCRSIDEKKTILAIWFSLALLCTTVSLSTYMFPYKARPGTCLILKTGFTYLNANYSFIQSRRWPVSGSDRPPSNFNLCTRNHQHLVFL